MGLLIRRDWSDSEWDARLAQEPEATAFHTRTWARIVASTFSAAEDRSLWLTGADGRDHLVPAFAWRRGAGLLTTTQSSFPFIYGGAVPSTDESGTSVTEPVLERLRGLGGSLLVTGNPFSVGISDPDSGTDSIHTHLRALPDTDEEFWEDELKPSRRNDVRRMTKKGVVVEESRAKEDADQMHAFYSDSFARWGGNPGFEHPREFYRNLLEHGGDLVRLTMARYEGRSIGGVFTLRYNGIVHYFAGYFDHESRNLRANILLQIESMRTAIADRYRFYDFLPSGGHAAVEEFKEGLGGIQTPIPTFHYEGTAHKLLSKIRRS